MTTKNNSLCRILTGILCLVLALTIVASPLCMTNAAAADYMVSPAEPSGTQKTIYVSASGNDSNNGTSSGSAVKTIAKALELAKSYIGSSHVTIDVANGTYPITKPITITNAHTNKNYTLTIKGHGSSVVSGGKSVSGWTKHSGNIWKATLSGISNVNGFYVDGKNMSIARLSVSGSFVDENGKAGIVLNNGKGYSSFNGFPNNDRMKSCAFTIDKSYSLNSSDVSAAVDDIQLRFDQTFMSTNLHFDKVVYKNNKFTFYADRATMNAMTGAQMADYSSVKSYTLMNSYLFLDTEGEYFFDEATKTLYYYSATSPASRDCVVAQSEGLLTIEGTQSALATNVRVLDMDFAYGTSFVPVNKPYKQIQSDSYVFGEPTNYDYTRMEFPAQITLNLASNVTFTGCSFKNIDTSALAMRKYVYNTCVAENEFQNINGTGIVVSTFNMSHGYGITDNGSIPSDLKKVYSVTSSNSIIPAQLTIRNNLIQNCGIESISSNGILVYYGHNVDVVNNTVKKVGGAGISIGWGWGNYTRKQACPVTSGNIFVERNEIISPAMKLTDCAGIYTLGAFPAGSGCIIQNNFIDMTGCKRGNTPAIYLDEGTEYCYVAKNMSTGTSHWLSCRALPYDNMVISGLKGNSIMNSKVVNNYASVALTHQYVSGSTIWPWATEVPNSGVTISGNTHNANWKNDSTIMAIVNAAGYDVKHSGTIGGEGCGTGNTGGGGGSSTPTVPAGNYVYDVTVNYTNGATGEMTFNNPGLDDWDPAYRYQTFTVTPENNTATLNAFDPSAWIVNNSATWYQWSVTNPRNYKITYTITKALTKGDYNTHGQLTITVAGSGSSGGSGSGSTTNVAVTGVKLNTTSTKLNVGQTVTLRTTVSPSNATNKAVSWKSSNSAVAKVNANGVVTAMGEGTATITVTTKDGSKTATCTVTVNKASADTTIAVTGVTLNSSKISLYTGKTAALTATVAPANATNKAVTWTTSDAAVATVDSKGVVTAVGAGTATITVTTKDGSKTATCTVTVAEEEQDTVISVTGVTLDQTTGELEIGKTVTLVATVAPADATNSNVSWTTSDEIVATVENGVVTAMGEGTATITVTTEDGAFSATFTVTVTDPTAEPEDPTEPTDPSTDATEPSTDATEPSIDATEGTEGTQAPTATQPAAQDDQQKDGGMPGWAIALIVAAVAVVGAVVAVVVIKKRK